MAQSPLLLKIRNAWSQHCLLVRTVLFEWFAAFQPAWTSTTINVGAMGLIDSRPRSLSSVPSKPMQRFAGPLSTHSVVDWVPRSVRHRNARIESTRAARASGRQPTQEMASALKRCGCLQNLCGDARIRKLVSLDAPVDDDNATPLSERIGVTTRSRNYGPMLKSKKL